MTFENTQGVVEKPKVVVNKDMPIPGFPDFGLGIPKELLRI
jgi:hypothetical protein